MKRILFLFFCLWALCLSAENIPVDRALKKATDFFRNNSPQLGISNLQMVYDGETQASRSAGTAPALYVFDNPNGKGFVVVAGDEIARPVLGYSFENNFPKGELPEPIKGWLEGLKKQINDGREKGMEPIADSRSLEDIGEVVVQLKTAQWGQRSPYNTYCPSIDGKLAPTGCVITATAIVMHYHQWPEKGTGTLPGYTVHGTNIEMPEIELGHIYDWNNMPYMYETNKYSSEQGHQVARLMADLGTMLTAVYGVNGTGSTIDKIPRLLPVYMDYDKSMYNAKRSHYSKADWYALLNNEFQQGRPIIYSGNSKDGSHAFVLDGYTSKQFYSINWGWGGSSNGYFLLDALETESDLIMDYHFNQSAIIGLKPNEGGDIEEKILMGSEGISTTETEFQRNSPFEITVNYIVNGGSSVFDGKIMWALTDESGNIKEQLETAPALLLRNGNVARFQKTLTITVPIAIGDRIRMFYNSERTPEWTLIKGGDECTWELLITDEYSIDETTRIRRNKEQETLIITTKEGVNVEFVHSDGSPVNTVETVDQVTTIQTEGLPAGVYVLKLKKTFEYKEVKIKLGSSQ